jgi:predicted ATP-binding protein involved in virulence
MRLKQVRLQNFRCFEDLRIPLHSRLTVFVAPNGGGKTAILDAIACLLGRVVARYPGNEGARITHPDIQVVSGELQAPFAYLEGELISGVRWSQVRRRDKTRQTQEAGPAVVGENQLTGFLDPVVSAVANGEATDLPVVAYYGTNRAVLEIPERKRNFNEKFSRFDAMRSSLKATSRFKDLFEWMTWKEFEESLSAKEIIERMAKDQPDIAAKQVVDKLLTRGPELTAVRSALSRIVLDYKNPHIKTKPIRLVLEKTLSNGKKIELRLQMLSDGVRTMIGLTMDLARRMAQANPHKENPLKSPAICLIDEIDLHLHPSWQQRIVPDLLRTFPETQFILTTHSPQVLTSVHSDNVRILRDEKVFASPEGIYGAESKRTLERVLNTLSRPPRNERAKKLNKLFLLIDTGNLEKAKKLALELGANFGGNEPAIDEALTMIDNRLWEKEAGLSKA